MKKIYDYDLNAGRYEPDAKRSPFAIYNGEALRRFSVDRPTGIWLTDLDKEICKALSTYLVLTSDLLYRLFSNQGCSYEKKEIQIRLAKLSQSAYLQKLGFESDSGYSASKAYVLSGRGIGYLNSMGIRYRLGGYLAAQDHVGLKRILAGNQLLIAGICDSVRVSGIVMIEPKNEHERSFHLFRPTATCFNRNNEAYRFIEAVRRTTAYEDLQNKLERMVSVHKRRSRANIRICEEISVVLVAEDYRHMCEMIAKVHKEYGKKLNLLYTYDLAIYSSTEPEDALFEYSQDRSSNSFLKKLLAPYL